MLSFRENYFLYGNIFLTYKKFSNNLRTWEQLEQRLVRNSQQTEKKLERFYFLVGNLMKAEKFTKFRFTAEVCDYNKHFSENFDV